ncbi:MAG: hypothetical protein FJ264_04345 [Planctomycetes bacterium]|nr:hypothetical protein [Planctomycetota bacterium]
MNPSLNKFIAQCESLPEIPSEKELRNIIAEFSRKRLSVDEYILFSDYEYKRNVLHVSAKCEIVVLCFKSGQYTPIHDHGGSAGIAFIYKGIMTEELFDKHLSSGMIVHSAKNSFLIHEVSYIDISTIHRVSNAHNDELVAINIYFPPLTAMNIYNTENALVKKWTAESYGKRPF